MLEEGKQYTLVVARTWLDARGEPLKEEFCKTFRVTAPVEEGIEPKDWKLKPPTAGGAEPLTVAFPRPLDHAMLQRALWVTDARDQPMVGKVTISEHETRWQWTPDRPWEAGEYKLVIDTTLEDVCGNRVGRPFEVDVFRPVEKENKAKTVTLPFRVGK